MTAVLPHGGATGKKRGRPRKQGLGLRPAARALGIPVTTLQHIIEQGRGAQFPDGSIDVERTRIVYKERTDPAQRRIRSNPPPPEDGGERLGSEERGRPLRIAPDEDADDIREVRMRQMRAKAEAMERVNALAVGDLVNRAEAEKTVFELARDLRNSWQGMPGRVYADVAAELGADPDAVRRVLMRVIDDHLRTMSDFSVDAAAGVQ